MKQIKNILEKLEPKKEKRILHTVWDAVNTFFFVPPDVTHTGAHIRDGMDIKRTMFHVVIALQVCMLFGMWNIGHQHYAAYGEFMGYFDGLFQKLFFGIIQMLPIVLVTHIVGLGIEFIFAARRGHSISEGFLVSGALIPLIMPPDIPLWMVAAATGFAVILGKEAFGGTGMNLLNVALLTRAFVFFAYPGEISGDYVWVAMEPSAIHETVGLGADAEHYGYFIVEDGDNVINPSTADGFTGATPLALAANGIEVDSVLHTGWDAVKQKYTLGDIIVGTTPGSIGETSKLAILFGLVFLLMTRIASWRIMLGMLLGCCAMGVVFNMLPLATPFMEVPWYYHIWMGGFLFAMAFMATDPVTASQTTSGKWVYGFMIGSIGMIVRVMNPAYPEGWMLAILLMNVFAPTIDHVVVSMNIKKRLARG